MQLRQPSFWVKDTAKGYLMQLNDTIAIPGLKRSLHIIDAKLHSDLMVCGYSNIRSDNAVSNVNYLSGQEVLGRETPWTLPHCS